MGTYQKNKYLNKINQQYKQVLIHIYILLLILFEDIIN